MTMLSVQCARARVVAVAALSRIGRAWVGALVVLVVLAGTSTRGDIIMTYQDVGSDLQFDWSGSLAATAPGSTAATSARLAAGSSTGNTGIFQYIRGINGTYSQVSYSTGNWARTPAPNTDYFFGNSANFISALTGATISGDTFGMEFISNDGFRVYLPANYSSGTSISGSMTIPNQSISSTGITDSSYTLSGGVGTISLQAAAVPEPSAVALCGAAALASLGFAGVRRLRRRVR